MKQRVLFTVLLLLTCISHGKLSIEERGDNFAILNDGKIVVESLVNSMDKVAKPENVSKTREVLQDGTIVWNRWCKDKEARYRLEVAQHTNGTIELSLLGESGCGNYNHARKLDLMVPKTAMLNSKYEALAVNGRDYIYQDGTVNEKFTGVFRWLSLNGVIFDFNPIGCTDYCMMYNLGTVRGVSKIYTENGNFVFGCGSYGGKIGTQTGTKIVIRNGNFNDYFKLHAMKSYRYGQHLLPSHLYCFGAPAFGNSFQNGNILYNEKEGHGWLKEAKRDITVGYKEGAYYSHLSGNGKATYRISNLPYSGFYVCTLGIGNYTGEACSFSVTLNGKNEFEKTPEIGKGKTYIVSRTVHITNGVADFEFDGKYMLSVIGIQPLMADAEDFQMQRGFWVTEGYEPGSLFRSCDYKAPFKLTLASEMLDMPVPGTEMPAKPKQIPRPVKLPVLKGAQYHWLENIRPYRLLSNSASLAELDDANDRKEFLDSELNGKNYNAAMLSGMHSRHTYMNHIQRGIDSIKMIADECHARGMKLIDHHDATLLWNSDSGLRCLAERLPEVEYGVLDNLPSFQLCISNPTFNDKYYGYLRELLKAGVDGFQLDEIKYWSHGCACAHCRKKFTEETGCTLPLNECDKRLENMQSPLWKIWHEWHAASVTNWLVELRNRTQDIKPDLVLSTYTTHWGQIYSLPRNRASVDLLDTGRVINLFGTEVMTRNTIQSSRSLIPYRRMGNIYATTYDSSIWGWYYDSNWQTDYFSGCVANMMNQSSLLASGLVLPADIPAYGDFFGSAVNMKRKGTKLIAEVGLFFSKASKDWNSNVGFDSELFGLAQEMECLHIPYEFIWEGNISDDFLQAHPDFLKKYKVIAIGATGCMADKTVQALRSYVQNGGTIYMTTIAGVFNEYGTPRKTWPFADIFGFSATTSGKRPIFKALSYKDINIQLKNEVCSFAEMKNGENALLEKRAFGKGTFIYSSVNLAGKFWSREISQNEKCKFDLDENAQKLYQAMIGDIFADAKCWSVNGAGQKIYTSLWRENNGNIVIHLLNASGANLKLGEICTGDAPKVAFPKIPEDISFTLFNCQANKATAYSPDYRGDAKQLKLEKLPNGVKVYLPKELLDVYAMIRLEK